MITYISIGYTNKKGKSRTLAYGPQVKRFAINKLDLGERLYSEPVRIEKQCNENRCYWHLYLGKRSLSFYYAWENEENAS